MGEQISSHQSLGRGGTKLQQSVEIRVNNTVWYISDYWEERNLSVDTQTNTKYLR